MPTGHYQRYPRAERISVACPMCGLGRSYTAAQIRLRRKHGGREPRYCSMRCAGIASRNPLFRREVKCTWCAKLFLKRADHIGMHRNHYCSRRCQYEARKVPGARWRDPAAIKAYMAAYLVRNREQINAKHREYRQRHRSRVKGYERRRTIARRRDGAVAPITWRLVQNQIIELLGNRCLKCGTTWQIEADHVVPIARGGTDAVLNIQSLCRSCNAKKHRQTIDYRTPQQLTWLREFARKGKGGATISETVAPAGSG